MTTMTFHWPSFLIGYGAGVATSSVAKRLRPLAVELLATAYRLADGLAAKLVIQREAFEDLVAEARARARGVIARPEPAAPSVEPPVVH